MSSATTINNVLVEPRRVESINGFLNITITLEESVVTLLDDTQNGGGGSVTIRTRTYNGTIPGPTLVVKPGDTMNIKFVNLLQDQGIAYRHNQISAPDESNLHFHGLYVSGEAPSDDATIVVRPDGGSFDYTTTIPQVHHPGTHWIHPHRHASTALQVGGGAAAAIIVEDDVDDESTSTNSIPSIYTRDVRQIVMVVQPLLTREIRRVAEKSNDQLFQIQDDTTTNGRGGDEQSFMLINGQIFPTIVLQSNEWTRLRIVYAAWSDDHLQLSVPGCQVELIAKDGIYLSRIPRPVGTNPTNIVPGGRADLMIRCSDEANNEFPLLQRQNNNGGTTTFPIANIVVETSDNDANNVDNNAAAIMDTLPSFEVTYPDYLQDLQSEVVEPACSCITNVGGRGGNSRGGINGFDFEKDRTTHYYEIGKVAERTIRADNHPYHQHVYPFQIQSGFGMSSSSTTAYDQIGDWHDTIEGDSRGTIRFRPQRFDGKLMIHCHRLDHEDEGMMGIERHGNQCECGEVITNDNDGLEPWVIAVISVGAVIVVGAIIACICIRRRRRNKDVQ